MPEWSVIQPVSEQEWDAYYTLRYDVLRAPWNQDRGTELAGDDPAAIHGMILDDTGSALAVGRIHKTAEGRGQIRFMAVRPDFQGRGLGKAMLRYIEHIGKKSFGPFKSIQLQAREEAVKFYIANGYSVREKTFLLFDNIQHYLMVKDYAPEE